MPDESGHDEQQGSRPDAHQVPAAGGLVPVDSHAGSGIAEKRKQHVITPWTKGLRKDLETAFALTTTTEATKELEPGRSQSAIPATSRDTTASAPPSAEEVQVEDPEVTSGELTPVSSHQDRLSDSGRRRVVKPSGPFTLLRKPTEYEGRGASPEWVAAAVRSSVPESFPDQVKLFAYLNDGVWNPKHIFEGLATEDGWKLNPSGQKINFSNLISTGLMPLDNKYVRFALPYLGPLLGLPDADYGTRNFMTDYALAIAMTKQEVALEGQEGESYAGLLKKQAIRRSATELRRTTEQARIDWIKTYYPITGVREQGRRPARRIEELAGILQDSIPHTGRGKFPKGSGVKLAKKINEIVGEARRAKIQSEDQSLEGLARTWQQANTDLELREFTDKTVFDHAAPLLERVANLDDLVIFSSEIAGEGLRQVLSVIQATPDAMGADYIQALTDLLEDKVEAVMVPLKASK